MSCMVCAVRDYLIVHNSTNQALYIFLNSQATKKAHLSRGNSRLRSNPHFTPPGLLFGVDALIEHRKRYICTSSKTSSELTLATANSSCEQSAGNGGKYRSQFDTNWHHHAHHAPMVLFAANCKSENKWHSSPRLQGLCCL